MKRILFDERDPAAPVAPVRGGTALLVSAALHATLVLAAFVLARPDPEEAAGADVESAAPASVQLMYVPPVAPAPAPVPATAPATAEAPRPTPEQPAAPPMREVPDHDEPAGRSAGPAEPEQLAAAGPPETTPEAERTATAAPDGTLPSAEELMRSEAQRIFGRPARRTVARGGPAATPGFEVYVPPHVDACQPAPARRPGEPVELATVSGRVYREGTRIPLPGAHLQMIGTPYVTFADDAGVYDLRFDPALVDRCRTQYVRVTAPGFRAQTLVLYLGPSASNDIPMSRR